MRTLNQKRTIYPLIYFFILIISVSCQDTGVSTDNNKNRVKNSEQSEISYTDQEKLKKNFAEVLAKALKDSYPLRKLIKKEALKKFNKDYDVLYHMIKNEKLSDGQTVHNFLTKYFDDENNLNEIENTFPLLTIFVPKLPEDTFSAKLWDIESDIPQVALSLNDNNQVPVFDSNGEKYVLEGEQIPAFPVVILKNNERVIVSKNRATRRSKQSFFSDQDHQYSYIDETFNGSKNNNSSNVKSREWLPDGPPAPLDNKLRKAWDLNLDWHRDYIYYSLEPGKEEGAFDDRYREYITTIKFISGTGLYQISNSSTDPAPSEITPIPNPSWTDGVFEFHINVLINSKNGVGQNILKVFAAEPEELFRIEYERNTPFTYVIKSIEPIPFNPYKLEILPWNLENYGTAWKFTFEEFDASETQTKTKTHTSKFATNFGFDVGFGEEVKKGFKFGISNEETKTQTYTVETSIESDQLGEVVVEFNDPVVTEVDAYGIGVIRTNEFSTGTLLMSLDPMKSNDQWWEWVKNNP